MSKPTGRLHSATVRPDVPWTVFFSALLCTGCVQLVAFEQPVIGQPDITEEGGTSTAGLCDPDVQMGLSALCSES